MLACFINYQEEYNLKENNCEHLVTLATIGFPLSIQVHQVIHQALQCSKAVVKNIGNSVVSHTGKCGTGNMGDFGVGHQIAIQVGYSQSASHLSNTVASKGGVIATEVGTTSAAKATAKTTSKAAFEAGSEAAISGTLLGAIGGIAFGVNVLLETPFYIRGAYKLHRQKKFDMISKEDYKREMIKISFKSANTVIGGTLGAVAGQAAIPVPVLGAVVGGFVGSLAGQVCGHLEGKVFGLIVRDPAQVTLPMLHTLEYKKVDELSMETEVKSSTFFVESESSKDRNN